MNARMNLFIWIELQNSVWITFSYLYTHTHTKKQCPNNFKPSTKFNEIIDHIRRGRYDWKDNEWIHDFFFSFHCLMFKSIAFSILIIVILRVNSSQFSFLMIYNGIKKIACFVSYLLHYILRPIHHSVKWKCCVMQIVRVQKKVECFSSFFFGSVLMKYFSLFVPTVNIVFSFRKCLAQCRNMTIFFKNFHFFP